MEKIKGFLESEQGRNVMVALIVVLVGLGSFELGRLSKTDSSSGVKIEYNGQKELASVISALKTSNLLVTPKITAPEKVSDTNNPVDTSKSFFASKRGKKYYPVGCTAGNTIKQENRIYFDTREAAEKAGYVLSSSCR